MIVGIGFLIRALGGQALFWVSWLRLPIARSLQLGDGLWFYAVDAHGYMRYAEAILRAGPTAVFWIDATYPSHFFVQVLTIGAAAFGPVASVAILLNTLAYLTTCLVIVRVAPPSGPARLPCLVALAAVTFGPGAILWSLQPLKDTVLTALAVAMVGACAAWQSAWSEPDRRVAQRRIGTSAAGMLVFMYAIAGTRWYFGAIIWIACAAFLVLTAIAARRRWMAALAALVVFLLLAQSLRLGGADDISPWMRRQLDPRTAIAGLRLSEVTAELGDVRRGFDSTPGASTIASGRALSAPTGAASLPPSTRAPSVPVPASDRAASFEAAPPGAIAQPAATSNSAAGVDASDGLPGESRIRRTTRLLAVGVAALVLPVSVGQELGLLRVGGGRNLWAFVELDTIAFDLVLLFAIAYCARWLLRGHRPTPLFVMFGIVLAATALPMAYTVTNFGTLFRLREMIYVLAAVLPLTLASDVRASGADLAMTTHA
jgi:hypothetical protein